MPETPARWKWPRPRHVCVSGDASRLKSGDPSQTGELYLLAREALEYHACVAADPKIRQRRLVPL